MCWLQQSAQLWSYPSFLLVPLIVVGGIECFAGYRAWRFLLGLNGAVLGFVAGAILCMLVGAPMLLLIGGLLGGVAGAYLFAGVAPVGTFIFAFGSMASLTMLLAHVAEAPPQWITPLAAAAGLTGAAASLARCRPFMIAMAAVAGAQQIASAWRAYDLPYGAPPLPDGLTPSESVAFIALAAAGLLLQFARLCWVSRKQAHAAAKDRPEETIPPGLARVGAARTARAGGAAVAMTSRPDPSTCKVRLISHSIDNAPSDE